MDFSISFVKEVDDSAPVSPVKDNERLRDSLCESEQRAGASGQNEPALQYFDTSNCC